MKGKMLFLMLVTLTIVGLVMGQSIMTIEADQGNLDEIINGDTTSGGIHQHDVYKLVTLDKTYKFTGPIIIKDNISIVGELDETTGRPPCIQPKVLEGGEIPATPFIIQGEGAAVNIENLYILAYSDQNTVNGDGVAISVTADNVRLSVDHCVFDGWQAFGIGYNGNWCDFFITDNYFRNMVHPNQHYIGEVIRNTWPGEAYTDSLIMTGNVMLAINGYAACPVTKYYTRYFEFVNNKVLWTFKNPFFIFNVTDAKINNNIFYANYAGGVDQNENPWWDNLWYPDESYGVIALQPLNLDNAKMFLGSEPGPTHDDTVSFLALAESQRKVEVKNNIYYWPSELVNFWNAYNDTANNKIITPGFMNERTIDMFNDDVNYPYLIASGNVEQYPEFMGELDPNIMNGANPDMGDIGFFKYFIQIRTGTAVSDYWGYGYTNVDPLDPNWVPTWPLPEAEKGIEVAIQDKETRIKPVSFKINKAYPNPFNPTVNIEYTINKAENISLKVYNVLGQEIMTILNNEHISPGVYTRRIDLSSYNSGIYFIELKQGENSAIKKVLLIK